MMVNVLIVEDSRISRNAFERELMTDPGYAVIASIENAANAELLCRRTMAGEFVWPEETPAMKIGRADSKDLTGRELEVIRELAGGARYGEIAEHLNLSENTVKYHVKNILQKTGFRSTLALVAEVVEKKFNLPKY